MGGQRRKRRWYTAFKRGCLAGNVTLQPFGTQAFTATVSGLSSSTVNWQVNGLAGGSQTTGLISSRGTYSAPLKIAPSLIPASGDNVTLTITAISQVDSTVTGTATITLLTQQQATQSGAVKLGTSGGNINDRAAGSVLRRNSWVASSPWAERNTF